MPTLGEDYDPSRNSLNFLRLVLAALVVFSHSLTLGGFGGEAIRNRTTLGTVAVYGFFGLSGYLIAGSAIRHGPGRFVWQRCLRILPAFWVCLIITAFGFGVIAWLHGHSSVAGYLNGPQSPATYVTHNFALRLNQQTIHGTLTNVPSLPVWNGSLWTLFYEFLCYLILGALAVLGLLRRRVAVLLITIALWVAEIVITSVPSLNAQVNLLNNLDLTRLLILVPTFLTGSLLYLYRDQLPDAGWIAAASTVLFLSGLFLPVGNNNPTFTLTSTDLTAIFAVYPLLWLAIHLPFHRIGATNDYSYGVYIYAFPVQQLLAMWGLAAWGYVPYTLSALAVTMALAVASWWLIERHALRLTHVPHFSRPI